MIEWDYTSEREPKPWLPCLGVLALAGLFWGVVISVVVWLVNR